MGVIPETTETSSLDPILPTYEASRPQRQIRLIAPDVFGGTRGVRGATKTPRVFLVEVVNSVVFALCFFLGGGRR